MELDKAIEAMEKERANIPVIPHSVLRLAHLLGIEAMKYRQSLELEDPDIILEPLPGED